MTLSWKKPVSRYYIESGCGDYTVSKAVVHGRGNVYTAWNRSSMLECYLDADKAKARCQQHKDSK
jgi:hypothetical protein